MGDEKNLPRHPRLGEWLAANPVEGVEALDRLDGLGPRAIGWPRGMAVPDLDAWAVEKDRQLATEAASAEQAKTDRESRRAALREFRDGTGDLTARQITAVLRILVREVMGS